MIENVKKGLLIIRTIFFLFLPGMIIATIMSGPNIMAWLSSNPPAPEITYGEFPFRIEYELHGERLVIEDTVICEFDGFKVSGTTKRRAWKTNFMIGSGEGSALVLQKFGNTTVYCCVRNPEYYMGDRESEYTYTQPFFAYKERGDLLIRSISTEELLDVFGIKLISWQFSDPIVNTFK